jgi:hypothetical protein
MSVSQASYRLMKEYDSLKAELKLIEEHFEGMTCHYDKQSLLDRYISLLFRKAEIEYSFKELKKWGSWKCVA